MGDHPIRAYITARGIGVPEFAFRVGVSPASVYEWLRGAHEPSGANLRAMATAYPDLDLGQILSWAGQRPGPGAAA